ncbi:MAG: ThiF family adenylyltransferase [Candidatus Didemnitutus sp.]|nr:ThiF family adenylyltransferase [Candidatus Didemnitutus sp.]
MSSALINLSPDLLRLRNEGFEVAVQAGHLVIGNVPYVNARREVVRGMLVSELTLAGNQTARPSTHVALFAGSQPCNIDGSFIGGLQIGEAVQDLGHGLIVHRTFSNKPPEGYGDYYAKMSRYITILSAPARALDPTARAQTFKPIAEIDEESPFVYLDTNTSRAHLGAVTAKLRGLRVAIVGVGGTGSYVLDLVAKTPVREIHLFDGDVFLQHNAFRAPGAAPLEKLAPTVPKVDYFREIYAKMHKGIVSHAEFLVAANAASLTGFDYVFLCMDASEAKRELIDFLLRKGIPCIDAGLGVQEVDGKLLGLVRVTTLTADKHDHRALRISCIATAEDDYSSNIQIADLNMLNAAFAVLKWKKLAGFYVDYEREHNSLYTLSGNLLLSEDIPA